MTLGLVAIILAPNAHTLLEVGDNNNNSNKNFNNNMDMKGAMDFKETENSRHDQISMGNNNYAKSVMRI
jgi:hypothetical protein